MPNYFFKMLLLSCCVFVVGCSTLTSTERIDVDSTASWVLLPVNNLSSTPQAGEKARSMVENHLRLRGVTNVEKYVSNTELSLVALLDNERQLQTARQWAMVNGYRYGLTGTVHEWHYKSGPDKEPAVGLGLKLIDLSSNAVLWQGTAAKTGWGLTSLSALADGTIGALLKKLRLVDRDRATSGG